MDWVALGEEIIKLGIPILGAVVSNGASPLLSAALQTAFSADTVEALQSAITADPKAVTKLQYIQAQHAEHIKTITAPEAG